MSPKALYQTAGKMVLPFTEVRKTEEKQDSWGCTRSSILEKSSFKSLGAILEAGYLGCLVALLLPTGNDLLSRAVQIPVLGLPSQSSG